MSDIDSLRGTPKGFTSSVKSTAVELATVASVVTASATAQSVNDADNDIRMAKTEHVSEIKAPVQESDSLDYVQEAEKQQDGNQENSDNEDASATITFTSSYGNGRIKDNETIEVVKNVVDKGFQHNGNASIITQVTDTNSEYYRNGQESSTTISVDISTEKLSPHGNETQNTEKQYTTEQDRKGRIRSEEKSVRVVEERELGAFDIYQGYTEGSRSETEQKRQAEYDRKGRKTSQSSHFSSTTLSKVRDDRITAKRGGDLSAENDSEAKLKEGAYAYAIPDRTVVKYEKYDSKGEAKKSLMGRLASGAKEIYTKIKYGKRKQQRIKVESDGSVIEGSKSTIKGNGERKDKQLSEKAAARYLSKLRQGINENLENLTGAQDMAEYSSSIPQTGKADTQSLDVYFTQRHDMEKIGEISDSLNQQNAQTLEMSKKETAKDIMREVVLQKGKEGY